MRKRAKFLLASVLLSFGLLATQYVPLDYRLLATSLFFFVTYGISSWALWDELSGIEWFTVVPFPGLFAVAMSLFYFLLPENILSRIAVFAAFGVGMYAVYLTSNIYAVAKTRTIQLLRAAHAIGLYLTLILFFLFTNALFSYRLPFWMNGVGMFIIAFPLTLMQLWAIELKKHMTSDVVWMAISASFLLAQSAVALSFFPATLWTISLYLVGVAYAVLGVLTTKITGKLFLNTVYEYAAVWGVIVLAFGILLAIER